MPDSNFPLCSSFLPTILEGQLCYKLKLNKTSGQGKKNELMLLLDYNEDRSLQTPTNEELNFDTSSVRRIQGASAKVQINTLSPYTGFGGGTYTMTVVKKISAKDDFLGMSSADRRCEIETFEDCRTRRLIKECDCVPWEMPMYQVGTF